MKRLLALFLAACGSSTPAPTCAVADGPTPDAVGHIGCAADYVRLGYDDDPFVNFARTRSVSVIIDRQADRLYFLDTAKWWLHFDFVWFVLEGHAAGDPGYDDAHAAFSTQNYYSDNRRFILAKLVDFVDQDRLVFSLAAGDRAGAAIIREGFEKVRGAVFDGERLLWHPVSNAQEQLAAELPELPTISSETLYADQTYQPLHVTVGFGTLRFRRANQLGAEPPAPTEIVVLDRVPADISTVAGIVTGEFQTPLSHINILAKNRGTPNMALRDAWDDATLRQHEGQLVKLTVGNSDWAIAPATPVEAQAYWDAMRPSESFTPLIDDSVTGLVSLAGLGVTALPSIGAKAANFAQMGKANPPVRLPGPGFAVPVSAFDAHMTAAGLWPEVEAILAERAAGALDDAALEKRLFHLRMALYEAPMPAELRDALFAPLQASFGDTEVRLRSSTNVEDLPGFSGAGLYTSVGFTPSEGAAIFEQRLKVVWASAWNHAAFVEREFYRVDQRRVRMGVLVHPAFADERANGVALTQNLFDDLRPAYVVNAQIGDISVANPSGAAIPEQIIWYTWYPGTQYEVLSRSSLAPAAVLADEQYAELATQLMRLRNHFNPIWCQIPGTTMVDPDCSLDVEWKLAADGTIMIKQARPLRGRRVLP